MAGPEGLEPSPSSLTVRCPTIRPQAIRNLSPCYPYTIPANGSHGSRTHACEQDLNYLLCELHVIVVPVPQPGRSPMYGVFGGHTGVVLGTVTGLMSHGCIG